MYRTTPLVIGQHTGMNHVIRLRIFSHPRHRTERTDDRRISERRERVRVKRRRRKGQRQDRLRAPVEARNDRLFDLGRQIAANRGDRIANVLLPDSCW